MQTLLLFPSTVVLFVSTQNELLENLLNISRKRFFEHTTSFQYKAGLTRPISFSFVNITMIVELCSHNMRQKSSVVSASGPCVAMYAFL